MGSPCLTTTWPSRHPLRTARGSSEPARGRAERPAVRGRRGDSMARAAARARQLPAPRQSAPCLSGGGNERGWEGSPGDMRDEPRNSHVRNARDKPEWTPHTDRGQHHVRACRPAREPAREARASVPRGRPRGGACCCGLTSSSSSGTLSALSGDLTGFWPPGPLASSFPCSASHSCNTSSMLKRRR